MKIRPLIIGPEETAAIEAAVARAKEHPVHLLDVAAFDDQGKHAYKLADRPEGFERTEASENVLLPVGYRAAISFERQPAGLCRHLSVSVEEPGKLPSPEAVAMIAQAFGVPFPPTAGHVWLEEFDPGHSAVNLLQLEPA